jgi:ubiquinone/menaquinone biosynthesis C-methylase UbiE
MRRPEFIARQSRCPTGLLGWLIATVMASETASENDAAITALDLGSHDRVLELGCGHGRTLAGIAAIVTEGLVVGVDLAEDMVRMTKRRCAAFVGAGTVEVKQGDGLTLSYPDAAFDKALTMHTLYFWRDPLAQLREIRRVLVPGGRLVLGFRPRDDVTAGSFPASVYRFYEVDEVVQALEGAGYERVVVRPIADAHPPSVEIEPPPASGVLLATAIGR